MTGRLRWGILGPGGIAGTTTSDLVSHGFAVTAVGSRSIDRARGFADHHGIRAAHGDYESLVTDPNVDVVYVASPHSEHYSHARLTLEAGKHVLCEKAFTVTGDQAEALADLAERSGLVILEAMWTRFLPHMVRIRELVRSGALGDVRTVIADHTQKLPADPAHRLNDPKLAGGALLDLGIYPVSFAWDVFGAPETISARADFTATGVDRQTSVVFGYANGQQALLQAALDTAGPTTASVIGTDGWIDIETAWYRPTTFVRRDSSGEIVERFDGGVDGNGMWFQALELERLVGAGASAGDILPPRQSVAIMRSVDEVRAQIGLDYPLDIMGS